jgi:hypothetical protein
MSFEKRTTVGWAVHPGEILKQEFLVPLRMTIRGKSSGERVRFALTDLSSELKSHRCLPTPALTACR